MRSYTLHSWKVKKKDQASFKSLTVKYLTFAYVYFIHSQQSHQYKNRKVTSMFMIHSMYALCSPVVDRTRSARLTA